MYQDRSVARQIKQFQRQHLSEKSNLSESGLQKLIEQPAAAIVQIVSQTPNPTSIKFKKISQEQSNELFKRPLSRIQHSKSASNSIN